MLSDAPWIDIPDLQTLPDRNAGVNHAPNDSVNGRLHRYALHGADLIPLLDKIADIQATFPFPMSRGAM